LVFSGDSARRARHFRAHHVLVREQRSRNVPPFPESESACAGARASPATWSPARQAHRLRHGLPSATDLAASVTAPGREACAADRAGSHHLDHGLEIAIDLREVGLLFSATSNSAFA
jgi:hypothetical protein